MHQYDIRRVEMSGVKVVSTDPLMKHLRSSNQLVFATVYSVPIGCGNDYYIFHQVFGLLRENKLEDVH